MWRSRPLYTWGGVGVRCGSNKIVFFSNFRCNSILSIFSWQYKSRYWTVRCDVCPLGAVSSFFWSGGNAKLNNFISWGGNAKLSNFAFTYSLPQINYGPSLSRYFVFDKYDNMFNTGNSHQIWTYIIYVREKK